MILVEHHKDIGSLISETLATMPAGYSVAGNGDLVWTQEIIKCNLDVDCTIEYNYSDKPDVRGFFEGYIFKFDNEDDALIFQLKYID